MWKKRRKERRENEGEREREERRGRERRIENRESGTRNVLPSPDAFPSTKLGNNMTSIKGRLGKNTTPTSRGPTKLNQNLQADPRRRRSSFDASFRADLNYTPEGAEYPKYKLHSNEAAIYKKAKALGNLRNHFRFSINQHERHSHLSKRLEVERLHATAQFDKFDYSAQVIQPKSQISSGYSAHKASMQGAQRLSLTSSTTLHRPYNLRVRSA